MTYSWIVNAEFCQNFEEETGRIEPGLDPINSPVKDETAMNLLRLESRIDGVVDYLARLKVAMSRIDPALWPEATLQNDIESLMTRLKSLTECRSGRSLLPGVALMWLCLWFVSTARRCDKISWQQSRSPTPRGMTSDLLWRLLLLQPLGSPTASTWTSSSSLPVLLLRSEQTFMPHLKFASECRVVFVTVKLFRAECLSTLTCGPDPLGFI